MAAVIGVNVSVLDRVAGERPARAIEADVQGVGRCVGPDASAGVKDSVEVCAKDAMDTLAWRTTF